MGLGGVLAVPASLSQYHKEKFSGSSPFPLSAPGGTPGEKFTNWFKPPYVCSSWDVLASREQFLAESSYPFMGHHVTSAQVSKCSDLFSSYGHPSLSRFQVSHLPGRSDFLMG